MEEINEEKIDPETFFNNIKNKIAKNTEKDLCGIYDNCLSLLDKYKITGQVDSMKKILFIMECIEKEKQLVNMGLDCFVYR